MSGRLRRRAQQHFYACMFMNIRDLIFPTGAEEYGKVVGRVFAGHYQASNGIPRIRELGLESSGTY